MTWPESAFWDYSLLLYSRPGVEHACLALQQRHDLNVNVVLFACWLAERGITLDQPILARAEQAVSPWHQEIVRPLRGVRAHLADQLSIEEAKPKNIDALLRGRLGKLRKEVLALELDGEHIVQLALDQIGADLGPTAMPGAELAGRNLACFACLRTTDLDDIGALLRAAFPAADEKQRARALRPLER